MMDLKPHHLVIALRNTNNMITGNMNNIKNNAIAIVANI
jgi:hypothetical protein